MGPSRTESDELNEASDTEEMWDSPGAVQEGSRVERNGLE